MKNYFIICCLFVCTLSLTGCNKQLELRYEECHFVREDYYEEWVVESCEGVSAEIKETSVDHLTVKLHNSLEHDIEFQGWSRVFVYRDGVWYAVLPPKDIATSEEGQEKTAGKKEADTILAGDTKEFICNFPEMYQGQSLPTGDYRMSVSFNFLSPREPERMEHEKVWLDFTIE